MFNHLHVHNEYSFLDGLGTADEYASKAKEIGFSHLGITNHGNVDGCIKFQDACINSGIVPIIGCELYVVNDIKVHEKGEKRKHLTVFVKNIAGWSNLLKMLTIANLEGQFYRPRVDPKIILDYCEGLVFSSACSASVISEDWGVSLFKDLSNSGSEVLLEVMPHLMDAQRDINSLCVDLKNKFGWHIIATNDCHYVNNGDEGTQEVLLAIQSKKKWTDPTRWKFSVNGLYLKNKNEMIQAFRRQSNLLHRVYMEALENSQMVIDLCQAFNIPKLEVELPLVPGLPIDKTDEQILKNMCERSLVKLGFSKDSRYISRVSEELSTIIDLGFARYFLIVWELIDWCKKNDIMTGPGRGSVGGSLVAYLLGITMVDPIEYGLVFARFISPARIDLPDIDMDFEDTKRYLIFQHLKDLYGDNNVAGASTFSTMKGRGAIHDVARVFNVSLVDVNKASKSIVVRSGGDFRSDFTIADAFATFEDGKEFKNKYPEVVKHAIDLEGQVKGIGQHAAAMVISSEDLKCGKRAYLRNGKDGELLVNWEKNDLEHVGLMKLDVLGLNALTVLNEAKKLVKTNYNVDINFEKIPLDDPECYAEFSKGNNIGCFQVGSLGLRRLCVQLGVENFIMLVHATSLHRPGTLRSGMTIAFIARKNGRDTWESLHPILDEITKDTYGIILYQEQVMKFMYDLGGLGWKTADTVRKVISKSQGQEQFLRFKQMFADGCVERKTLDKKTAEKLWDELASFGSYGFNLSHAVEYSMITYWDMWFKVHYPEEFICSSLSYGNESKKEELIEEAFRLGLDIKLPEFGKSDSKKWKANNKKLYIPFIEIKGIGDKIADGLNNVTKTGKGFFNDKGKKISSRVALVIEELNKFNNKEEYTEEDREYLSNFFSFSISKNPAEKYEKMIGAISEHVTIKSIGDIDWHRSDKDFFYYFGQMSEIRFGYRDIVSKLQGVEKLEARRTADSLGGVYGNLKDKTDFVMLVFDRDVYNRKKFQIEHCSGDFLLARANRLANNNINCSDVWFSDELRSCELDRFDVSLVSKRRFLNKELLSCADCGLREEATAPILPSMGINNIMIIGEAPGKDEDKAGAVFIGPAGNLLWDEFEKVSLKRRMFHVSNIVKCFPSVTKTPDKKHIKSCKRWIEEEIRIIRPITILAFGNTSLKFFKDQDSGIMEMNGKTEWNEKYGCWISWCIHPASVLYHRENLDMFKEGIDNFKRKVSYLGL